MNRAWKAFIGLSWLSLPLVGVRYGLVWDQLPARVASHFDAYGRPNGWMPREVSLGFTLVMMVFMLALFSFILSRVRKPDLPSWSLMGLYYVILGTLFWVSESVLQYNLHGQPIQVMPVILIVMLASFIVAALFLGSKRGVALPEGAVLAEEVHSGPLWALVLIVPAIAELAVIVTVPIFVLRAALGLAVIMMCGAAALAWDGFHYLFTPSGLEIPTLGFRLRSIPAQQIREYAADRWNPIGGYGIRGIGERRAYVWGNQGVRIKTVDGEVFLGHNDPARIVRDLDVIKAR